MPPRPDQQRPLVVFVDLGTMLSFDQLASVLRSRGVEVAHLSSSDNPLARFASRVLYDHSSWFATPAGLFAALARLDVERIVDVQCPEFLLDDVVQAARLAGLPRRVLTELEHRFTWRDKYTVAQQLHAAGIPAPRTQGVEGTDADDLVAAFGLPLVVKDRVGSGGEGVRIVHHREDFEPALQALGGELAHLYVEQYLPGETLCWAAAVVDGAARQGVVYRTRQGHEAEGPSTVIEVVADDEVMQLGCRVARLVGGAGLLNLDLVRDAAGSPRVVDVNVRAWHSVVALSRLGADYPRAYLQGLGLQPSTPDPRVHPGAVAVFPSHEAFHPGDDRLGAVRRFLRGLAEHRRVLPGRYRALQVLLFARRLLDPRP